MAVKRVWIICLAGVFLAPGSAPGKVSIDWVTVGDPKNVGEGSGESYGGQAPDRICGAVGYVYRIGKCEVANVQYAEFLNAVDPDGTNPYGLYNTSMAGGWSDIGGIDYYSAAPSGQKYSVRAGRGNKPVNYVSWYDALRFANWMTNGQGTGDTESGAYAITGSAPNWTVSVPDASQRETWANGSTPYVLLASEDEWYKAAYYKGGDYNAGYWDYATQSDTLPDNNDPNQDSGNSANYNSESIGNPNGWAVGPPDYTTDVGAYESSLSAYGTADQSGNLFEWNEADLYGDGSSYGVRGGSFYHPDYDLPAYQRSGLYFPATYEGWDVGFRVALVEVIPEPLTMLGVFAGIAGLGGYIRKRLAV